MAPRTTLPVAFAALVALATPLSADEWAVEAQAGYFSMTAEKSASALFDSTGGGTFGGAARYTFGPGIFVSAGMRTFSRDGERVFLSAPTEPVAKLGFPLSVRIRPIFLTAGYRYRHGKLIVPYAGLGASRTSFREESEVAGELFEESRSETGFHVLAGVEVGRGTFRFGGEAVWSTVPDAVGFGGVTRVYGEDDLGGWSVLGKVVVAFGGP